MGSGKTNNEEQFEEIDLKYLKESVFSFLDNLGFTIYKLMKSILKKWYYFLIAIVIGVVVGYFVEQRQEVIAEETTIYAIIIAPKYESVDYLNRLVDTNFENTFNTQQLYNSSLKSIEDIYGFIGEDPVKAAIFGNLNAKFAKSEEGLHYPATAKNYHFQELSVEGDSNFDIDLFIEELHKYMSSIDYFKERKRIGIENLMLKKEEFQKDLLNANRYLEKIGTGSTNALEVVDLQSALEAKKNLLDQIEKNAVEILEANEVFFVATYFKSNDVNSGGQSQQSKSLLVSILKYVVVFSVLTVIILGLSTIIKKYKIREEQ